jgi:hypothetical protein
VRRHLLLLPTTLAHCLLPYAAPSRPRRILLLWPLSTTSGIHPIPIRRDFLLTAYLRLHGCKQVRPVFACPARAPGVVAVSNLTIGRGLPNPIGRQLHVPVRRRLYAPVWIHRGRTRAMCRDLAVSSIGAQFMYLLRIFR